jgi:hypothetical protein
VVLAWVGFGASVLVHVASLFGVSLLERFWFLHFGIFALAIPAAVSPRNLQLKGQSRRVAWRALMDGVPRWVGPALIVGFAYFVLNMIALYVLGEGGGPVVRNGRFVLADHGRVIRELTESEYRRQLSHVARMFSAGWALFYAFLVVWYSTPRSKSPVGLGRSDRAT